MAGLILAFFLVPLIILNGRCEGSPVAQRQCEAMSSSQCSDLGYNISFPNTFGHKSQDNAILEMHQFSPLISVGCGGDDFKAFICSAYFPKCDQQGYYPPCRSLCEKSKNECSSAMARFGFSWPLALNCSLFPTEGQSKCILNINELAPSKYPSQCGGLLTDISGTITSPNYPNQYPPEMNCRWTIKLPPLYFKVEITIEHLELEEDRNCYYDYVKILDKLPNQIGPRHCGAYSRPYVIGVLGNEVSIVFASDKSTSKKGFSIKYKGMMN